MDREALWKKQLLHLMPQRLANILRYVEDSFALEEIRIRADKPMELCGGAGVSRLLSPYGVGSVARIEDCNEIFERVCGHSVYAWEDELKNGFITVEGGYRVGLGGRVIRGGDGRVSGIGDISSVNIRIARAVEGAADGLIKKLLTPEGNLRPTLIISKPNQGKTTLLRDIVRQVSWGKNDAKPCRVCVVDERMEISGSVRGAAQFDLGPRTDVLIGSSKPEGIAMAVRTLSPELIATDELGGDDDAKAVLRAAFCGVRILATAHRDGAGSLKNSGFLNCLIEHDALERIVELKRESGVTHFKVYDGSLRQIADEGGELLCFAQS